ARWTSRQEGFWQALQPWPSSVPATTPAVASYPKVRRASPVARYWRGLHRAEASLRFRHAAFGPRRTLSDTRSRQPYVTLAHHNHRRRDDDEDRMGDRPCIHRTRVATGSN